MSLDDRKTKILQAIIQNYLETGEPVGSRTISKYADLKLSSATIRNEMADLEELGYIKQPHTSAGRIPTDKAYRLYVDQMMHDRLEQFDAMTDVVVKKADKLDSMLQQIAKLLADRTNYASVVSSPTFTGRKLKFIQLTPVEQKKLLAVIVLDGNFVKNKMISLDEQIRQSFILKLNILLNSFLIGLNPQEITLGLIAEVKKQAAEHPAVVDAVVNAIDEAVREDSEVEVFTSGATNMLKYPELQENDRAAELLYTFEEKNTLTKLVSEDMGSGERGIQVYIGNENSVESMKDCSLVTATYELGKGIFGKIGIVGPKRMNYEKVVVTLQNLMTQLDDIFREDK